jgi:hypothetical protein
MIILRNQDRLGFTPVPELLGETEISEDGMAICVEKDVFGFQITNDYPVSMAGRQLYG